MLLCNYYVTIPYGMDMEAITGDPKKFPPPSISGLEYQAGFAVSLYAWTMPDFAVLKAVK
jgi:hypothetical protein